MLVTAAHLSKPGIKTVFKTIGHKTKWCQVVKTHFFASSLSFLERLVYNPNLSKDTQTLILCAFNVIYDILRLLAASLSCRANALW